jgi:glutamate-1-semialdehyde 2,1-aminomutase
MALSAVASPPTHGIDPDRIEHMMVAETALFDELHPQSRRLFDAGRQSMLHGVPMHWMSQWPGTHPIFVDRAAGARLWDADDIEYMDLSVGDSAALFGHANPHVASAIAEFVTSRGSTMMLPTTDAAAVTAELAKRFGLPVWQLAVSASDANRFVLRVARLLTGREIVAVFNGKYHGSVDETQVEIAADGAMVPQHGVAPNAVDFRRTTRLIEFNDLSALEQALADRKVACVLAEPMLTNIGMVPVHSGYHDALRKLTRDTGTLLAIDETHTICAGPGGCTQAWGLDPDFVVVGKVLAGGIPSAVWGMTKSIADALETATAGPGINHYGFGGTLAGNALTLHAMRATLEKVATAETYATMHKVAAELEGRIAAAISRHALPWHVSRIGARVEYLYRSTVPDTGGEAAAARDDRIEALIHLHFLNRGILLTPFHNVAVISPFVMGDDLDRYDSIFNALIAELKK